MPYRRYLALPLILAGLLQISLERRPSGSAAPPRLAVVRLQGRLASYESGKPATTAIHIPELPYFSTAPCTIGSDGSITAQFRVPVSTRCVVEVRQGQNRWLGQLTPTAEGVLDAQTIRWEQPPASIAKPPTSQVSADQRWTQVYLSPPRGYR